MADDNPYTTITVGEYNRLRGVIGHLRIRIQLIREALEEENSDEALRLSKLESDEDSPV